MFSAAQVLVVKDTKYKMSKTAQGAKLMVCQSSVRGIYYPPKNTQLLDGALQTICEKILDTELSPLVQDALIEKKNE